MTLNEYLAAWLDRQRARLQPSTHASYAATVHRYLSPTLGGIDIADLDPLRVETAYANLFDQGGANGRRLSIGTVRYVHAVLHKALADAVRLGVVDANISDAVELPRRRDDEDRAVIRVWTAEQARAFLHSTHADPLGTLWATALATGMRRGELLGLSWDDVDLDAGAVRVHRALTTVDGRPLRKETKTGRPRTIAVDAALPRRLAALRSRSTRGSADWRPVFVDDEGDPHVPMRITTAFRRLVRRLPVPTIRLHDMRHTHATLLQMRGVASGASFG